MWELLSVQAVSSVDIPTELALSISMKDPAGNPFSAIVTATAGKHSLPDFVEALRHAALFLDRPVGGLIPNTKFFKPH